MIQSLRAALLCAFVALPACGQKGPLVLPDVHKAKVTAAQATATATPTTTAPAAAPTLTPPAAESSPSRNP
jgi:predicted small lipoprotein YifL